MKVPAILEGVPRIAYVIAAPLVVFVATVAISLATMGGDNNGNTAVTPTETRGPTLANIDEPAPTATTRPRATTTPTASPTAEPTAEPTGDLDDEPNRADCGAIAGTDYLSGAEREWYLANCTGGPAQASSGGGGGAPAGGAPAGGGGGGGGGGATASGSLPYTGEHYMGDRLIIPGIDSWDVYSVTVPSSGAMPDPVGYHNVVWYDFSNFGGLGGYATSGGNHVIAGHVDSAVYGALSFGQVRNLTAGDTIQYVTSGGETVNYTVISSITYSANADFSGIVSGGSADLTLITCTGSFVSGNYTDRHVVQAVRS